MKPVDERGPARRACRGQTLMLLPERAAYWAERETLLIADPHFGKASVFRAGGIPIPPGTTQGNLDRIDALLRETGATRLFFLGDFLHGAVAERADFVNALKRWRDRNAALSIHLVLGNHDRFCEPLARYLGMACSEEWVEDPFVFRHHPEGDARGYVICGHVHPALSLTDRDGARIRARCFWFRDDVGVLPSFGEFTGSFFIQPRPGDAIYAVGDGHVVPVFGA